jgi:hypothetical protein
MAIYLFSEGEREKQVIIELCTLESCYNLPFGNDRGNVEPFQWRGAFLFLFVIGPLYLNKCHGFICSINKRLDCFCFSFRGDTWSWSDYRLPSTFSSVFFKPVWVCFLLSVVGWMASLFARVHLKVRQICHKPCLKNFVFAKSTQQRILFLGRRW